MTTLKQLKEDIAVSAPATTVANSEGILNKDGTPAEPAARGSKIPYRLRNLKNTPKSINSKSE